MKTLYSPEYEPLLRSKTSTKELVKKWGVTENTIRTWRRQLGCPHSWGGRRIETDHKTMDPMILDKIPLRDIAKKTGVSLRTVWNRKKELIGSNERTPRKEKVGTVEAREPLIPPANRLTLALEAKTADWSMAHREAFMHSPEGAKWAAQIMGGV